MRVLGGIRRAIRSGVGGLVGLQGDCLSTVVGVRGLKTAWSGWDWDRKSASLGQGLGLR